MDRTHRTRPARLPLRLAALALAGAALAACGGESGEPEATTEESPSATTSESSSEESAESPAKSPTEEPSEEPARASAEVTIKGGSVTPVAQSVEVAVGEPVTLRVTSDRTGELHVHATPEQYLQFDQGRSTIEMEFDKPGAVDVEEHESGALILRVLVQ